METTRLIFLWSGGISLMTADTVLRCDSVGRGVFVEEVGSSRVGAVAPNNEVLVCSSKMMRVGLRLHRDIGQLTIITSSGDTFRVKTLFVLHPLPLFLLFLAVLLHLHL